MKKESAELAFELATKLHWDKRRIRSLRKYYANARMQALDLESQCLLAAAATKVLQRYDRKDLSESYALISKLSGWPETKLKMCECFFESLPDFEGGLDRSLEMVDYLCDSLGISEESPIRAGTKHLLCEADERGMEYGRQDARGSAMAGLILWERRNNPLSKIKSACEDVGLTQQTVSRQRRELERHLPVS